MHYAKPPKQRFVDLAGNNHMNDEKKLLIN